VVLSTVLETISRYNMFTSGDRAGVAVSGGADSVCLLHVLRELAPRLAVTLSVLHVEHGIRGQASRDDAAFVRDLAARLDLPFHMRSVDIPAASGNLEQDARRARRQFFRELTDAGTVTRIATGHTRSDQAETVLYRILRGSGSTGLRGILPVTAEGIVRPLLGVSRAAVEAWLRERGIEWREDATNRDSSLDRNALRHDVLPMLRVRFNPRLDDALAQLAELCGDEESYWDELLGPVTQSHALSPVILTVKDIASAPPALARRRIRRAMETAKGDLRQIEFPHVEMVRAMADSADGHGRVQLPGLDVFRSFDWIRIAPAGYDSGRIREFELPLPVPGSAGLPGGCRLIAELMEPKASLEPYVTVGDELDWGRMEHSPGQAGDSGRLEVRNWRPGDRYCRAGSEEERVKLLFQEFRIPLWERRSWPIVTWGGKIAWTRRFGAAKEFAATPDSQAILRIRETKG
jgi:tRNA(Ile)-lysidine synthase